MRVCVLFGEPRSDFFFATFRPVISDIQVAEIRGHKPGRHHECPDGIEATQNW